MTEDDHKQMAQHMALEQGQINLVTEELNQELLKMAIDTASESWFWRFKSAREKSITIARIYKQMKKLIREE